jgi:Tol biopolymer transport system component
VIDCNTAVYLQVGQPLQFYKQNKSEGKMKAILNRRKFIRLTLDGCVKNERLAVRVFLDRFRMRISPYILSLSLLAGAYFCCNNDRVSSGDDLENRTKIVFASYRDGNMDICVMNPDGSYQTRLTNNPAKDEYPTWSPDGKRIAFGSTRDSHSEIYENAEVYIMNADGSHQTNLTNNPAFDHFPSWSPDGKKIAFASERDGNMNIYIMNADGSNQTRLTDHPAADVMPRWSPDGKKIAFQTTRHGEPMEIYVMNADGSNQTNLTNNPAVDMMPSWSPDGKKIAFASTRDGNYEIYVMNADGSNQTNLTNNPATEQAPSWSPDGKKIAFYSLRNDVPDAKDYGKDERPWYEFNAEIYVMNPDGSEQTDLTNNPAYDGYPSWSPFIKTDK